MVNISKGVEQINFYNAKPRVAVFTLCLMTQGRVIDVGMKICACFNCRRSVCRTLYTYSPYTYSPCNRFQPAPRPILSRSQLVTSKYPQRAQSHAPTPNRRSIRN